jgi:hypothetical protein
MLTFQTLPKSNDLVKAITTAYTKLPTEKQIDMIVHANYNESIKLDLSKLNIIFTSINMIYPIIGRTYTDINSNPSYKEITLTGKHVRLYTYDDSKNPMHKLNWLNNTLAAVITNNLLILTISLDQITTDNLDNFTKVLTLMLNDSILTDTEKIQAFNNNIMKGLSANIHDCEYIANQNTQDIAQYISSITKLKEGIILNNKKKEYLQKILSENSINIKSEIDEIKKLSAIKEITISPTALQIKTNPLKLMRIYHTHITTIPKGVYEVQNFNIDLGDYTININTDSDHRLTITNGLNIEPIHPHINTPSTICFGNTLLLPDLLSTYKYAKLINYLTGTYLSTIAQDSVYCSLPWYITNRLLYVARDTTKIEYIKEQLKSLVKLYESLGFPNILRNKDTRERWSIYEPTYKSLKTILKEAD